MCDLGTIATYRDNFPIIIRYFYFSHIKIKIILKSLRIKNPHLIRYIKVQIVENLNRSLLNELNLTKTVRNT